jgi:hypothetical protein
MADQPKKQQQPKKPGAAQKPVSKPAGPMGGGCGTPASKPANPQSGQK